MSTALNLSNEVVKMRAEVKRVKALLIRKLIRRISDLQKKKGSEADLEKRRRRTARLREEIHELKVLAPDSVTKAALQKDISFEKVCRDKEATLSDRATARIATHPQFSKKIQSIKAAIKAFKEERINARKAEKQAKNSEENVMSHDQPQADSDDDDDEEEDGGGSEKSDNEDDEEKLKDEEGEKKTDEQQELMDCSSQESQKTSLEPGEQTTQCQKEEMLTVKDSSARAGVPEEVIRMRKEVKRTRVAIISKMAEELTSLKKKNKKKGEQSEVKESQERAAEILKEIQALRSLRPDQVTMTALQDNAEPEMILQDPQSSPLDRAIAHIITHSRFINKLQKVKEAIKDEQAKAEQKKADKLDTVQSKNEDEELVEELVEEHEESVDDDDDDDSEEDGEEEDEISDIVSTKIHESGVVEPTKITVSDASEPLASKTEVTAPNLHSSPEKSSSVLNNQRSSEKSTAAPRVQKSPEKPSTAPNVQKSSSSPNVQSSPVKFSTVESRPSKDIGKAEKKKTTLKSQKKQDVPQTKKLEAEKDEEESDLSDDDEEEEKEYFDDSTEERFHKQSSQSEDSDDDDFFLGKVSKFKKRRNNQGKVEEKKSELQKPDKEATRKPQETNLSKFESVFCSALSKSTVPSQKAKYGSRNDGSRPPRFQNQRKGPEGRMKASQYKGQELGPDRRTDSFTPKQTFKVAGQRQAGPSGAGRGRSHFEQHQNPRGPPGKMSYPPQQSLHPSWEASKKRKEQQAQITAFQGKKIKFDDDD